MFDYTGYDCKSCGKSFTADDDIVVCPECGTPYHRDCYKKEGKCINFELHESRVSWKSDIEQKMQDGTAPVHCKGCGNELRADQLFCDKCGMPTEFFLKSAAVKESDSESSTSGTERMTEVFYPYMINYSDPLCGFNPEEEYESGLTTKDLGDFVGTSTHYYLPKFKLMKTGRFKLSMNIPALFFPEYYFAYRKMPAAAFMVLLVKTVIGLPGLAISMQSLFNGTDTTSLMFQSLMRDYPNFSEIAQRFANVNFNTDSFILLFNITNLINWILIFVFGSFANYMYYKYSLKKAAQIKNNAISNQLNISEHLRQNGGTSISMLLLFVVLSFIFSSISTYGVMLLI